MWFALALFAIGFILTAVLTPKSKTQNAKAQGLDQFNAPRSKEGDPVPRFYGTKKLTSPNTIALTEFKATPIKVKQSTGIFSSKKVTVGYKYSATLDLAWALGPGVVFRRIYFGKNKIWGGCLYATGCVNEININLPELYGKKSESGSRGGISGKIRMYCGSFDQPADAYMKSKLGAKYPAYVGVAHMVLENFYFGNSAGIDTIAVEASYLPCALLCDSPDCAYMMNNGLDANPIEVLYDILTYEWGNLGFSSNRVNFDNWKAVARAVFNEGNSISITLSSSSDSKDIFKTVLRQINAIVYENQINGGLVEIKLIRNDYDILDLPVLGPDVISEVRNYSRKLWSETNNVVRLKFTNREDDYAEKIASEKDSSLLRFQGREKGVDVSMPGIHNGALAQAVAARELSNLNVPLFSAEMVLNRMVSGIMPGAAFIWEWPEYGVERMIMRVRKIGLGTFEDGKITFSVVQDEFALDATVVAPPAPTEYEPTDNVPLNISKFKFFELPAWLDNNANLGTREGYTRLAAFVESPSTYSSGFDGYIVDGTSGDDVEVLDLTPYAVWGTLTSNIGRFDGFENGLLASVNVGNLSDNTQLDPGNNQRDGGGLVMIGDEILSYESYIDNGNETYSLKNVRRALFDTNWQSHSIDDRIYFFEGQENFFETDTLIGETPKVYLLDRVGTSVSQASTAIKTDVPTIGRVSRVVAPDYITANGSRVIGGTPPAVITLDARPRNRNDVSQVWFEDDAAAAPEQGTLYRIEWEQGNTITLIADNVALPYDWNTSGFAGSGVVRISAKKDGLYSIGYSAMPFNFGGWGIGWGNDWGSGEAPENEALPIVFDQSLTTPVTSPPVQYTGTSSGIATSDSTNPDAGTGFYFYAPVSGSYDLTFAIPGYDPQREIGGIGLYRNPSSDPVVADQVTEVNMVYSQDEHLIFDTSLYSGNQFYLIFFLLVKYQNTLSFDVVSHPVE